MRWFRSTDLQKSLGKVLSAANVLPVVLTKGRKPRYVLMRDDFFRLRFPEDRQRAISDEDMTPEMVDELLEALAADLAEPEESDLEQEEAEGKALR